VKGRTVLLVVRYSLLSRGFLTDVFCKTHNVALAIPIAQHVVSISQDGTVRSQAVEHFDTASMNEHSLISEVGHDPRTVVEEVKPAMKNDNSADGKLIIAEEIEKGHVTWKSMKLYFSALGGDYPPMFFAIWISATLLTDWVNTFQVWFLGYWGSKYEIYTPGVNPIP
jgi:hypothetical protein